MYHLTQRTNGSKSYSIFCDVVLDTTGQFDTIDQCLESKSSIKRARYSSLDDFLNNDRVLIVSFENFDTFKDDFPELFI